jgi:prepilin-type N-terminal cleavage/methylation domain-containing protein
MTYRTSNQHGFTLVELTLAMAILSGLLLIITQVFVTIVQQDRMATSVQNSTQNVRYAIDDISGNARTASSVTVIPDTTVTPNLSQVCLDEGSSIVQYFVAVDTSGDATPPPLLYKETLPEGSSCVVLGSSNVTDDPGVTAVINGSGSTTGIGVANFQATASGTTIQTLNFRLGVVTNYSDLSGTDHCTPGTEEFCSVTSFETSVSLRGAQSVGP